MYYCFLNPLGVCETRECDSDEDGRQQSCDGDGSKLSSLPVKRPEGHLREHEEGDGFHSYSYTALGYELCEGSSMMFSC